MVNIVQYSSLFHGYHDGIHNESDENLGYGHRQWEHVMDVRLVHWWWFANPYIRIC